MEVSGLCVRVLILVMGGRSLYHVEVFGEDGWECVWMGSSLLAAHAAADLVSGGGERVANTDGD